MAEWHRFTSQKHSRENLKYNCSLYNQSEGEWAGLTGSITVQLKLTIFLFSLVMMSLPRVKKACGGIKASEDLLCFTLNCAGVGLLVSHLLHIDAGLCTGF